MSSKCLSKNFTFGIELEYNIYDPGTRNKMGQYLSEGWGVKPEHCGTEIVSPILRGAKGILECRSNILKLTVALALFGQQTLGTENCGLHVHVGLPESFTLGNLKRLLLLTLRFENALWSLMADRRLVNQYCRPLGLSEQEILKSKSFRDLRSIQANRYDRYYGCNIAAFNKHGTVEFRYSASTINWPIIYSLICLYVKMVSFAQTKEPIPIGIREGASENLKLLLSTIEVGGIARNNLLRIAANSKKKENVFGLQQLKIPMMKGIIK